MIAIVESGLTSDLGSGVGTSFIDVSIVETGTSDGVGWVFWPT